MMNTRLKNIYWFISSICVGLTLCCACTDDDMLQPSSDHVRFQVSIVETLDTSARSAAETSSLGVSRFDNGYWLFMEDENQIEKKIDDDSQRSRAAEIYYANFYDSFGVDAYTYTGEWNASTASRWMANEKIKVSDLGGNSAHKWQEQSGLVKFFAYAPYDLPKSATLKTTDNGPVIEYQVPEGADKQLDLLAASTAGLDCKDKNVVSLQFGHIMTAIRVVARKELKGITFKKIAFHGENIKNKGTYHLNSDSWENISTVLPDGASKEIRYEQEMNVTMNGAGEYDTYLIGDLPFMVLPQTLDETTYMSITFEQDGEEKVLTACIGGEGRKDWLMGHTITYYISINNFVFETVSPESFVYQGNTEKPYTINSYKINERGTVTPIPWAMTEYSLDGGNTWHSGDLPIWVTSFTSSGEGNTSKNNVTYSALVADMGEDEKIITDHNQLLKNAPAANGVVDLSNTLAETANCYIVNAKGTYKLPLVYGNSIKNGNKNESAYISSAEENPRVLKNFVNHLGNPITSPYIYENEGCTPDNAVLIWQDVYNTAATSAIYDPASSDAWIQDIQLVDDKKYLQFTVNDNIVQGNAIVAVRDANNTIMWSWHIWVTDYVRGEDKLVTTTEGVQYQFMPINVGWCYTKDERFDPRGVKVKVRQNETDEERIIDIYQTGEHWVRGDVTDYIFGRKDPTPALMTDANTNGALGNKGFLYTEGYAFTLNQSMGETNPYGVAIQNPHKSYNSGIHGGDWAFYDINESDYNLWNMANKGTEISPENMRVKEEVIKTIYDPSPVGYNLAPICAFTGFLNAAEKIIVSGQAGAGWGNNSAEDYNSPYTSDTDIASHFGFMGYCKPMVDGKKDPYGGTIFFPYTDRRRFDKGTSNQPTSGVTWAATIAPYGGGDRTTDPENFDGGDVSAPRVWGFYYAGTIVCNYSHIQRSIGCPIRAIRTE